MLAAPFGKRALTKRDRVQGDHEQERLDALFERVRAGEHSAELWTEITELDRRRRARAAVEFVTPKFTRKDVANALRAREVTFQNWQARDQLNLDADAARDGTSWRLYSARDVLRLGLAVKLSDLGFPASSFRRVMTQLDPHLVWPSPYVAANQPCHIVVLSDGEVIGPVIGETISFSNIGSGHFLIIRLDLLIREALEPLGYTIIYGSAEDMREAVDRLKVQP